MLTLDQLVAIADRPENDNMQSVLAALNAYGPTVGMDRPHRMAQYIAQIAHESARFRYDKEIWDGKGAQSRYEGRADLGNTQTGDGYRFRGRGPIQITGRANYAAFTKWAKGIDANAPDFTANPDAVNLDPWEGLGPIWYWDVGNPEGKSLNRYADAGNNEMVTRRINGRLNGYADRLRLYDRTALVLLRYNPDDIRGFQSSHGLTVDGISGPNTRAAMHKALTGLKAPTTPVSIPVVTTAPSDDTDRAKITAIAAALRAQADALDSI